jgi:type III restriction enzyme
MPKRTHHIDQLIVNSPFTEPAKHWSYDRTHRLFTLEGGRRPAGYLIASSESKGFDDPGVFVELPLVNQIRPRVNAWREANYPGVTGITRRLLEHWLDPEEREGRQFFFCQLEAIETLIWLTEASPAELQGIDIPGDGGPFARWCTKLATGTGKTVVMAMLIAWQVLNKVTNPQDKRFCKHVLAIAPGLTVKSRLSVLVPDSDGNYYDEFGVVPAGLFDKLRQGQVQVINWHKLDWQTDEELAKKKSVDKRGAKSDEAYVREVLGEMASARSILVLNDEAHHAWRVPAESKVAGVKKEEIEEATKWVGGLDRINRARGILRCHDFSATPFAPSGKKSTEEALFGWIVSDFGLNDAIEAGLVKTPRVVIRDDARLDAATYRSRLYHIYADDEVKDDLNRKAEPQETLPDLVVNGYYLLGKDWLEAAQEWKKAGQTVPPVMITVANRTETAARIKYAFDHGKIRIDELCAPDKTLHIDSKVLEKAESQDEPVAVVAGGEEQEEQDDEKPAKTLTKQQQAEQLRLMVDTVGQPGKAGAGIQNVISVGMLSEGWDAKTVTHVMGLRAFSSQLLCEQVVGRGLRRTSYDLNRETGLFEPEYVNIFGVPFTFLPHEGGEDTPPPPPKPKTRVEPLAEREAEFGIAWPNVIKIEHVYSPRLTLDMERVPVLELRASETAVRAEMAAVVEGKPDVTKLTEIDLAELAQRFRMQKIVFEAARDVFDQMRPTWKGTKEYLLAQVIRLVEQFLRSDRIAIKPASYGEDDLRRRIMLTLNMNKIVQHIWEAIRFENTLRLEPVFDTHRPIARTADMRPRDTSKPCERTRRSHINVCVFDSTWEATEAFELDRQLQTNVQAWAKNDGLGFEVMYVYRGVVRKYRPDFLIRLSSGIMLILEVKGQDSEEAKAKRHFLDEWVKAVNQHGGFGRWAWDVSRDPNDIEGVLAKHAAADVSQQFAAAPG